MVHVCTSIKGEFGIGNKCILLDEYVEVECCQNGVLSEWCDVRMSVTPLGTCLLYGIFGSGLIPMGYAHYVSLVLVTSWSISTHMFLSCLCIRMYSTILQ